MSEKIPASEGPKPGPPKSEHWTGPLKTVFGTAPEAAQENVIPPARTEEQMQPELTSEVNAIEDIAVEEPVETTMTVEAPILEPETPAESPEHESNDLDTLEAMFNQPAVPDATAIEVVQTTTQDKIIDEAQPETEAAAFTFVDKRNSASQEWSKDAQDNKTVPTVVEAASVPATHERAAETSEVSVPKRGDLSHHDYHAQRPSEGIYREGKSYKHAGGPRSGKFASKEDYEDQTGVRRSTDGLEVIKESSQKHYDEIMGLNEAQEATPERPSYESMDTDQLIFAYAKAEMIGDKFVTDDIRNVYTTAMEEAYTKPGSLISHEEHQDALDRFDRMAEAAIQYEKAKDPEHSALVDAAVERANKEPSIGDKLKKLWSKGKESVKKLFKPEYWGERFTNASLRVGEASTWALNLGVNQEDNDEEKDKKRNRNRVLFIAGGAAVAVAAIAGAYGIGYAVGSGSDHHSATEALTNNNGSGRGVSEGLSAHDKAVADSLTPTRGPDVPATPAPVPEVTIPAGFNVSNGEGGEQLFNTIGIDPQKWYANQESFLRNFPDQFYRMPGGDVGIAQPGMLPIEVRNAMEALK